MSECGYLRVCLLAACLAYRLHERAVFRRRQVLDPADRMHVRVLVILLARRLCRYGC